MSISPAQNLLIAEAHRRNWKVQEIGSFTQLAKITDATGRTLLFKGGRPPQTSATGQVITINKLLSLEFVESLGFQVPASQMYERHDEALQFLRHHKRIVVKPNDTEKSQGVTVGVTDAAGLEKAVAFASQFSATILLQKYLEGQHYRLLTVGGKLFASALRYPPEVVGDGVSTVRQLIERENQHPLRQASTLSPLEKIDSKKAEHYLGENIEAVPVKNEVRRVLNLANISSGGTAVDITETVHPNYAVATELISRELGLFTCGFDIISPDIALDPGAVLQLLEINSKPGYRMHHFPAKGGTPRNVAAAVLDAAFATEQWH